MNIFGHKRDAEENTDNLTEEYYGEEEYAEEDADAEEYYEEEEYAEEDADEEEYYGEEEYAEEDADAEEYYEEEEYAEEEDADAEEYYEEEEYAEKDDGEYYEEEEYAEEDDADAKEYHEEENPAKHARKYYGEDEGDGSEDEYYRIKEIDSEDDFDKREQKSIFGFGVIMAAGVFLVILAAVTGTMFMRSRAMAKQTAALATVGTRLDGIEIVGDQGLLAVADATVAKQEALRILQQQEEEAARRNVEYQETNYSKKVSVSLDTVSIQKDLKIKFLNKSSGKLISNVPFAVSIVTPDNKTEVWNDDDMDGIIYKKGITPGKYKITVNALEGAQYLDYSLPFDTIYTTAAWKQDPRQTQGWTFTYNEQHKPVQAHTPPLSQASMTFDLMYDDEGRVIKVIGQGNGLPWEALPLAAQPPYRPADASDLWIDFYYNDNGLLKGAVRSVMYDGQRVIDDIVVYAYE